MIVKIELEGEINQIKVASETGFRYTAGSKDIPVDKMWRLH